MQLLLAIGLTLSLIVITSCTTQSEKAAGIEGAEDTDSLMVVDCLLPGQVRQLGSRARYVTPRRPVKTTSSDCGIRGGEFTAYDRADYATSLKIWLPQAQAGDAEAQAYVGEIFEKGLGVPADYQAAAVWYEKAAAQNLPRAQINLANLYEKGLGVEKDTIMALNLYRRAAGLSGDSLQYASTILASNQLKNSLQEQQQIITDLQQEKQVLRSRQQILQEKNRELAQI
ncbi:MAG: sel1 repeat family protein, partial [Pseudomonadales bacterium]|nr:sel1 repeat family protein [Pseudomonadales bacterium]